MYMKCLIWIKKTIRGLEIFHWKCAFWFYFFLVFAFTGILLYLIFKKSIESSISCGKYVFLIFHTFSAPCHANTSSTIPPPIFISSSIFKSGYFCNWDSFLRIAFVIYRLPSLGTNSFCMICLKISHLSFVVKILFVVVILLDW